MRNETRTEVPPSNEKLFGKKSNRDTTESGYRKIKARTRHRLSNSQLSRRHAAKKMYLTNKLLPTAFLKDGKIKVGIVVDDFSDRVDWGKLENGSSTQLRRLGASLETTKAGEKVIKIKKLSRFDPSAKKFLDVLSLGRTIDANGAMKPEFQELRVLEGTVHVADVLIGF